MRGLGPNEVDLRGTRSPSAATAVTSAADTGLQITAVPPLSAAAAIAAWASWWTTRTVRGSSRMSHQPADEQLLQDGGVQAAPVRRASLRHGGRRLDRIGVGEQVQILAGGADQEGGPWRPEPAREARASPRLRPAGLTRNAGPARATASASGRPGMTRWMALDARRVGGGVDQQRQALVPRAPARAGRAHPRPQLQVGGVAVVPVGDERLPGRQVGGDRGQLGLAR